MTPNTLRAVRARLDRKQAHNADLDITEAERDRPDREPNKSSRTKTSVECPEEEKTAIPEDNFPREKHSSGCVKDDCT